MLKGIVQGENDIEGVIGNTLSEGRRSLESDRTGVPPTPPQSNSSSIADELTKLVKTLSE